MSAQEGKRPLEGSADGDAAPAKSAKVDEGLGQLYPGSPPRPAAGAAPTVAGSPPAEPEASGSLEDEFDAIFAATDMGDADLQEMAREPDAPPEEQARKAFAERLAARRQLHQEELSELLNTLETEAPQWGSLRRWRSVALLLVYVARSSRICRAAFVAHGLELLGALLQEGMQSLETAGPSERQEAGMWCLAVLACLRSLPLGRATLWEHRTSIGKPFDRLHKWCAKEKSALAAELRAPTQTLCRRWKRQPKPANQEHAPEQKALRRKVVDMIAQGLMGVAGTNSPASPAPFPASPGIPPPMMAAEVEAALFARHSGATPEYRQHARMLRSNLALAGNLELRNRVLSGELEAGQLVAMDSSSLAPEAMQKERRDAELKAMKETVVKSVQMGPHVPISERSWSDRFLAGTAPLLVTEGQHSSGDLKKAGSGDLQDAASAAVLPAPMEPPPTPLVMMEPAPTPFRGAHDGHHAAPGAGGGDDEVAEAMPTPAMEEQNDEEEALMRYLTADVK